MRRTHVGFIAFAALIVLAICWLFFVADVRTKKVIVDPSGQITEGTIFGVSVGDDAPSSVAAVRQAGFTHLTASEEPPWFAQRLRGDSFIYAYDLGWRHGVVCIALKDGSVQAVAWHFNMLAP